MKEMEEPTARTPEEDSIQWYSNESKEARRFKWAIGIAGLSVGIIMGCFELSSYLSDGFILKLIFTPFFFSVGILFFSIVFYVDYYRLPHRIGIGEKGIYAECRKAKYSFFLPYRDISCIRRCRFFRKGYEIPCYIPSFYGNKRTRDALPVTKEIGEILIRTRSSVISALNKDYEIL